MSSRMPPYDYDSSHFNFWGGQTRASSISIECLLPNGLSVPVQVQADISLEEFKTKLWKKAQKLPLFHFLKDKKFYVFSCVDRKGGIEELIDETRSIYDVQPFKPYFKVAEKKGDAAQKLLNSKISMLIGKSLTEFDNMDKIEEVHDFRRKYQTFCEHVATQRRRATWGVRAVYSYPPQFAPSLLIPDYLQSKIQSSEFIVNVAVAKAITHTFHIPFEFTVTELVTLALKKKASTLQLKVVENSDDFVLKTVGRRNFLFGSISIDEEDPKLMSYKV